MGKHGCLGARRLVPRKLARNTAPCMHLSCRTRSQSARYYYQVAIEIMCCSRGGSVQSSHKCSSCVFPAIAAAIISRRHSYNHSIRFGRSCTMPWRLGWPTNRGVNWMSLVAPPAAAAATAADQRIGCPAVMLCIQEVPTKQTTRPILFNCSSAPCSPSLLL